MSDWHPQPRVSLLKEHVRLADKQNLDEVLKRGTSDDGESEEVDPENVDHIFQLFGSE